MVRWEFKSARLDANGGVELCDLSPAQLMRIEDYTNVLETASASTVASPIFSHYFVKEGIGIVGEKKIGAGNIEYGLCQALHGEESAIAAFRSCREKEGDVILGIVAGNPGNIASPCGNCRDIMLEVLKTDFEIVCGSPEGGIAVVVVMSQYLFEDFEKVPQVVGKVNQEPAAAFKGKIRDTFLKSELLLNDAYSPPRMYLERKYGALIVTLKHDFFGARDIMCDYHPIYAFRDAIRQARRERDPFVQMVLVVCEDFGCGAPHVMYKDRQHLLELNVQQELLLGIDQNPFVYLATYRKDTEEVTGVWKTSVKEWLPFPFSPRNFGPEFSEYLKNYFQNQWRQS